MCRLFSWVTHFSTRFWVDFIRDQDAVRDYVSLNQSRLRQKSLEVSSLLHKRGIPHLEANAGLFIWLNLSKWLEYFPGGHEDDQNETQEVRLTRHMIKYGVYMGMGSVSLCESVIRLSKTDIYPRNACPQIQVVIDLFSRAPEMKPSWRWSA